MTIKIEKGIPLPTSANQYSETLEKMDVGDSFFVEPDEGQDFEKMRVAIYQSARKLDITIATRKENNGLRVWRTEVDA